MKLHFDGAARSVTGSRHLLETRNGSVLLDCGLYQGPREEAFKRNRVFGFDPKSVHAVILSHAHIDHSGALPALVKSGWSGPIYATPATADLAALMLADSASIQERDTQFVNRREGTRRRGATDREIQLDEGVVRMARIETQLPPTAGMPRQQRRRIVGGYRSRARVLAYTERRGPCGVHRPRLLGQGRDEGPSGVRSAEHTRGAACTRLHDPVRL
jgi:metal-dependent hydrolase (beta-lactamase superfamily II)